VIRVWNILPTKRFFTFKSEIRDSLVLIESFMGYISGRVKNSTPCKANRFWSQTSKVLSKNQNVCRTTTTTTTKLWYNQHFGQSSKFWTKIKIIVKGQNFGQRSKFWSNFEKKVLDRTKGHAKW